MTLVKRQINLSFQLAETGTDPQGNEIVPSFGGKGNRVDVTGLRVSCQVSRAGGVSLPSLTMRVWGLPIDVMQKLSVLNIQAYGQVQRNSVSVTAGDDERGFGVVFTGDIIEAWVDAAQAPDVCLAVQAVAGGYDKARPVLPTSFKGSVAVDTIMASLANQMEPRRNFENHGVEVVLDNGYFPGTLVDQAKKVADAAQCEFYLDDRTLAIWPVGKARGGAVLDLNASTGLVGYPQFAQTGVTLTTLFTPSLSFGQKIRLRSALGYPADGDWVVANVIHNLDSEIPGGQWFTVVECGRDGYPTPIIQ